jgi:hypothetical protein
MQASQKVTSYLEQEFARFQKEIEGILKSSPARPPTQTVFETPEPVKKGEAVIRGSDPKKRLTPGRSGALEVALRVLTDVEHPATVEKYSKRYRQGLVGEAVKLDSPEAVEAIHGLVEGEGGDWVSSVVAQTKVLLHDDYTGIRLTHLEKIERKRGGFHFCPLGHIERSSIEVLAKNEETGVWVGRCRKKKISSFFPDDITTREDLTLMLLRKKRIASYTAKGKSKQLSLISNGEKSFYVLDYRREEASILTAFPLFFAKYLSEFEDDIVIPGVTSLKKADLERYFLTVKKSVLHKKIEISISDSVHLIRIDGEFSIPEGLGVYIFVTSTEMNYKPVWI